MCLWWRLFVLIYWVSIHIRNENPQSVWRRSFSFLFLVFIYFWTENPLNFWRRPFFSFWSSLTERWHHEGCVTHTGLHHALPAPGATILSNASDYWNDRRSRRVFFCFYSAIFQLTSAKFQTFAYNAETVRSSFMKFWQQFEINELYVCTKFRGNRQRDFGFRTRKPPRKFGVKSGLSQKRLKYGKKYIIGLYVSRYPFIPTNSILAAMRFISFFPFFFFLIFVRSSSPKPQHIEI